MVKAPRTVGIFLFDNVELLDFAGPMQVLSSVNYVKKSAFESISTIASKSNIVVSKTTMTISIDEVISEESSFDLLIIPGGFGTRPILQDDKELYLLDQLIAKSEVTASVCTGSLILAKLGYLSGLKATTHFAATDLLMRLDDSIELDRSKRFHDHDKYLIAEGVSAGIDMSLYLVAKYFGQELSDTVRRYIEYYPEKE